MPKCKNCGRDLKQEDMVHETRWRCPVNGHPKLYRQSGVCEEDGCNKQLEKKTVPMGYLCPECGTVNP